MADSEGGSEQDDVSFLRTVSISFPFFLSSFVGYGMEIFLPLIFMIIFMVQMTDGNTVSFFLSFVKEKSFYSIKSFDIAQTLIQR